MSKLRRCAIELCRAAAADPGYRRGHYAEHAIKLGYNVSYVRGSGPRGTWRADYTGPDMEAVELASSAWLAVDPEPLGIEKPSDPRRDLAAAELLEKGWTP